MEPFRYPPAPHARLHGPRGYADYSSYRPWLRDEFSFRCVYCLTREQWGRVSGSYDLDHFVPISERPEEEMEYDNLLYACRTCNLAKAQQVIPDPLQELIGEKIIVYTDGRIDGRTDGAKRLIRGLALNSSENIAFRRLWIDVLALAERYDSDLLKRLMSYPDNLPDLSRLRPPGGNSRPDGVGRSCFARRAGRELDEVY